MDAHLDTDGHAQLHPECDRDLDAHGNTQLHAECHGDVDADMDPDCNTNSNNACPESHSRKT